MGAHRARDCHTLPWGGYDQPFWDFLYSAYGASEPCAWASQTKPWEAQTFPFGISHTVPVGFKPRVGTSHTVPLEAQTPYSNTVSLKLDHASKYYMADQGFDNKGMTLSAVG